MIHMQGVGLVYPDGTRALRGIDLHIGRGEFAFIVGASGSGKSSLAGLIYREHVASEGRVIVGGQDVAQLPPSRVPALRRKVGVIFQTTHALELCREIINELVFMCKEVHIINTICRPVQNRQDDALDLAEAVDLMLVVGSRTSANTMELAALCRFHNPRTLQIQSADDLQVSDFVWAEHIGIASGLSTPEDLVEDVRAKILACDAPVRPDLRPDEAHYALADPGTHGPANHGARETRQA